MKRTITIELPDIEIKVPAVLQDKEEPEMCEALWEILEKPLKMACEHTLSTGDYFSSRGRPPRHPVSSGSQAAPVGRKKLLFSQLEPGWITYPGGYDMGFPYGPEITEPLMSRGPVVAKINNDNLKTFWKMGRSVWNAQYMTHTLMTVVVRKEEL